MNIKSKIRSVLNYFHLDLTKNLKDDRLTKLIIKKHLSSNSNCIDIGCHLGEMLEIMIGLSPNGNHFAFEPIPSMFDNLKNIFGTRATILPYALASESGSSSFQFVKNAPAYSGLKKRTYAVAHPDIEEIEVTLKPLDDCIPKDLKIDLIKIDVEGAELGVLQGAKNTILRSKPLIIFEFGLGASDHYNTSPSDMYALLVDEYGLKIYTLASFLNNSKALTIGELESYFQSNKEYYFVAK